jgi:hypothetical protein
LDEHWSFQKAALNPAAAADLVVGAEGSQRANGFVCMKDGGSMLVLQPTFRFNNIYKMCATPCR